MSIKLQYNGLASFSFTVNGTHFAGEFYIYDCLFDSWKISYSSFCFEDIIYFIPIFTWLLQYKGAIFIKSSLLCESFHNPWTQDVNWTSYVRSIYILCPGGNVHTNLNFYFQSVRLSWFIDSWRISFSRFMNVTLLLLNFQIV